MKRMKHSALMQSANERSHIPLSIFKDCISALDTVERAETGFDERTQIYIAFEMMRKSLFVMFAFGFYIIFAR